MGRELPTNLVRRGSRIWVRIEVPPDVRDPYGKAVVFESTKHDDDKKGRAAGLKRLAELQAEWAAIRAEAESTRHRREPTPADHHRAALDLYASELVADERRRDRLPTAEQLDAMRAKVMKPAPELRDGVPLDAFDFLVVRDAAKMDRERRGTLLKELRHHLGSGETALVADMADDVIRRERLAVDRGSVPWRRLCRDLARAWIAALETQEARDAGDYTTGPTDPLLTARAAPVASPGEGIMDLYDKFHAMNPRGSKDDTLKYGRPIVQLFADTLPPGAPASTITKKAVVEWVDLLGRFPKKAADMTIFRGMKFREIVAHNATLPAPKSPVSKRTVNKYIASLSGFCKWLVTRGALESNPATGLQFTLEDSTERRPYTLEELQRIFTSPVYTGFEADRKEHLPGELRTQDWRFWIPLLGLYTGARLGELSQLLTADVRCEAGAWVLYITTEGDEAKSLKTAGSRRVIPVHATLIRLGFLDHHAAMVARGERRLWPELKANTRGHFSGVPSRWWGKYTARIGLKTDASTVFHSFRHGLADEFRRLGYLDQEFNFILGHTDDKTTITRGYGILSHGNLERRIEMMGKVGFPGLDLSHLDKRK